MANNEAEAFWIEKEKQNGSKLIISTAAEYLGGYPGIKEPSNGLLYLMNNGIYFENFEHSNWFSSLLNIKTEFQKVEFNIGVKNLIACTDSFGNKNRRELSFKNKLLIGLGLINRRLVINAYLQANQPIKLIFNPYMDPLEFCEKYDLISNK